MASLQHKVEILLVCRCIFLANTRCKPMKNVLEYYLCRLQRVKIVQLMKA